MCAFAQDGPCDSSHLVSESDDSNVAMTSRRKVGQPLAESGRISFHLHHHGSGAVKHHASQVLISKLVDTEQSRLTSS
jgi:hypothetical protein